MSEKIVKENPGGELILTGPAYTPLTLDELQKAEANGNWALLTLNDGSSDETWAIGNIANVEDVDPLPSDIAIVFTCTDVNGRRLRGYICHGRGAGTFYSTFAPF